MKYKTILALSLALPLTAQAVKVLRLDYDVTMETKQKNGPQTTKMDVSWLITPNNLAYVTKKMTISGNGPETNNANKFMPVNTRIVVNVTSTQDFMVSTMLKNPDAPKAGTQTVCMVMKIDKAALERAAIDMDQTFTVKATGQTKEIAGLRSEEYLIDMTNKKNRIRTVSKSWYSFTPEGKSMIEYYQNFQIKRGHHLPQGPMAPDLMEKGKNGSIVTQVVSLSLDPSRPEEKVKMTMLLKSWKHDELSERFFELPKCDMTINGDYLSTLGKGGLPQIDFKMGDLIKDAMPSTEEIIKKSMPKGKDLMKDALKGFF